MRMISFISILVVISLVGLSFGGTVLQAGSSNNISITQTNGNDIISIGSNYIAAINLSTGLLTGNSTYLVSSQGNPARNDIGLVQLSYGESYTVDGNTLAEFIAPSAPSISANLGVISYGHLFNYTNGSIHIFGQAQPFPTITATIPEGKCGQLENYTNGTIRVYHTELPCVDQNRTINMTYGENVTLSNSTYKYDWRFVAPPLYNEIYNITAPGNHSFGGNLTVDAKLQRINKVINLRANTTYTNSTLNVTYACNYPKLNKTIVLYPGDSQTLSNFNLTVMTPGYNSLDVNWTALNLNYDATHLNNCIYPLNVDGETFCAQETNQSVNITLICTKQAFVDHNLFEGLGGCMANFTKEANDSYHTETLKYESASQQNAANYSIVKAVQEGTQGQTDNLWFVVVIVLVLAFAVALAYVAKLYIDRKRRN